MTSRRLNGDNNSSSDRGLKPGSGAYSSSSRSNHPTGGWKTMNSSNNTYKPDSREISGRQGLIGFIEGLVTNTSSVHSKTIF